MSKPIVVGYYFPHKKEKNLRSLGYLSDSEELGIKFLKINTDDIDFERLAEIPFDIFLHKALPDLYSDDPICSSRIDKIKKILDTKKIPCIDSFDDCRALLLRRYLHAFSF